MWNFSIGLALAGALLTALSLVHTSSLLKKHAALPSSIAVLFTYAVASLVLCALVDFGALWDELTQPSVAINILIAATLLFISRLLYTHAYKHVDAGYVTLFSGITPILTILTAWLMLNELPTANQLLGIGFIVVSILVVFWRPIRLDGESRHAYLAAFLSTIPAAFSIIFQKKVLLEMSPLHLTFSSFVLIALFSLCYLWRTNAQQFKARLKLGATFGKDWIYIGILSAAAHVCFFYVVEGNHAAAAQAAQRSAMIFQVLLAYVLLKEKDHITPKLLASIIAIVSMVLLLGE